ncbi:MAG: tRNA uridine-5-carboxymethylaminomethyl(34) synthesis GTPase MnmE, partial [Oscillospiraceae bacterium]|nr:tRNA uridine-5-carboxymethylaminomethyl(34) synthesis GTPase MnmE [Oscillospiraceae bacterium]
MKDNILYGRTTIAGIATGQAAGGVGMVRVSGPEAAAVADRVFECRSGEKLAGLSGYRARYGRMIDASNGWSDDGVALVFRAPHSYTGEDVVELSCHGGLYAVRTLLRACLEAGASPAGRGEFTKRAFLNGKMSLTQAEAVMAVVSAEGIQADRAAKAALDGRLSARISVVTDALTAMCAHIGVWCDFPDDDLPEITHEEIVAELESRISQLDELINQSEAGACPAGRGEFTKR